MIILDLRNDAGLPNMSDAPEFSPVNYRKTTAFCGRPKPLTAVANTLPLQDSASAPRAEILANLG
jgi:hypothetical protein